MEEIKSIRISELKDFKNHPFHVQQDIELCALMKSIEDEGVIVPLLVRPNPDGEGYEVIAGHRRKADAGWAGLAEVPAVIRDMMWQSGRITACSAQGKTLILHSD